MTTSLKELPKCNLPRERLLAIGANNLSDEELLAILLRTGVKGISVSELSRQILAFVGDVRELKEMRPNKLASIKGLGMTKSVTILAALELGRRVYDNDVLEEKVKIGTPIDAYRFFSKYIVFEKQENFLAIFLDNHKKYISHKILFKGTLDSSLVHPREIFKMALLENASGVVVMHNHPSGEVNPSRADDETTRSIVEIGNMLGISVLDHLIVGNKDYYSYVEEGRMIHE